MSTVVPRSCTIGGGRQPSRGDPGRSPGVGQSNPPADSPPATRWQPDQRRDRSTARPPAGDHPASRSDLVRTGLVAPDRERPGPNQHHGEALPRHRQVLDRQRLHRREDLGVGSTARCSRPSQPKWQKSAANWKPQLALALNLNQASYQELTSRLAALLDEFDQRDDPDGTAYALFLAVHMRTRRRRQD